MHTTPPEFIRAIEISKPGGPENLQLTQRPCPVPACDEVLIKVAAAGVNRPDILQRMGHYPPPEGASDLPGLEVSGTIIAVGSDVATLKIGNQVCALLPGGGYADYAVANAGLCMSIPYGIDVIDCAGFPETMITVWANVFEDGALKAGETLLVHGGTSGIGMSAITMAKAWGADVIATVGSLEKKTSLKPYDLKAIYHYNDDDWVKHITDKKNGGVDVVLDMTGGDFVEKNLACLRPGGRHVSIAFLRGIKAEINILSIMQKRLTLTGSTLRARSLAEKTRLVKAVQSAIWPLLESGKIDAMTDRKFSLEEASKAHQLMESGEHKGKILLIP